MDPGERRQAHIAGGLGLVDREFEGGGTGVVVAGLALRASETGELVRLGLPEAETSRRVRGATEVDDGVVEPVLDAGQLAEHRVAAHVEPRVVDRSQPVLDLIDGLDAALLVAGGDRGPGGEEPVRGLIPRPVQLRRRARRCDRSAPSRRGTRRDATRRRRGSTQHRACRSTSSIVSARSAAAAMWSRASSRRPVDASIHAASSSALARSRTGAASPAASSAARIRCAPRLSPRTTQAQPNPLTRSSASSGSCTTLHANAASMLARSARAKARCSAWSTAAHPLRWTIAAASANHAACAAKARSDSPGVGHRFERERADAVEQPVANRSSAHRRRRRSPANGSRAGRPRRSPRLPARRALRGRTRPPGAVRRRRRSPAPTGRAGRRGTAARSSTGSST